MTLYNVVLTRTLEFLAEGETKDAVEKAARELATSPSEIEDWNADAWQLDSVQERRNHPSKQDMPLPSPDVVLVEGEFLHPLDAKALAGKEKP
jgi:hypothetical protein